MSAVHASALYEGRVSHTRLAPMEHTFGYRVGLVYLDLDEVEALFERLPGWSLGRLGVVRLRRADYLGDPSVPLDEAVRRRVSSELGRRPTGAVRMLTNLCTWGYAFNPVTFYYCFDAAGDLDAVVAEITNTPWRERHAYVLDAARACTVSADDEGAEAAQPRRLHWSFDKDFHVSPFFPMEQVYEWSFSEPGERLDVHMTSREGGRSVFHAGLGLTRRELTPTSALGLLVRHPLLTWRVPLAIYWQALRLYLKRAPFFVHPRKRVATGDVAR